MLSYFGQSTPVVSLRGLGADEKANEYNVAPSTEPMGPYLSGPEGTERLGQAYQEKLELEKKLEASQKATRYWQIVAGVVAVGAVAFFAMRRK
jgi:hypothetical protein